MMLTAGAGLAVATVCAQPVWTPVDLPGSCAAPEHDHGLVRVEHVFDGDTVRLADGVRVRLIGLDSPEFHHHDVDREQEPFAQEAREALMQLLAAHGHQVRVIFDQEQRDRYRRTLAHLFTPDGQSITALMLAQGLATRLTVPPNDWNLDCYQEAERMAAADNLHLWTLPGNRLHETAELPRDVEGFRRVEGRVNRLGKSPRALWINLEGDVALRIDHADRAHFPELEPETLEGKRVRARGYVYNYQGQPRIRIRHPVDLEVVEE